MWEPFSENARKAITLAQNAAENIGDRFIGTEHILLGLIEVKGSKAEKALSFVGVKYKNVENEIFIERSKVPKKQSSNEEIVFSPLAKKAIELAFEESRQRKDHYIGTEHLLLGILREHKCLGKKILSMMGVNYEDMVKITGISTSTDAEEDTMFFERPEKEISEADSPFLPFERKAANAIKTAGVTAMREEAEYITSSHLLKGVLESNDSSVTSLLEACGSDPETIERDLDAKRKELKEKVSGEIQFSDEAKKILEEAFEIARRLGQKSLSVVHLLLGILKKGTDYGMVVLFSNGVTYEKTIKEYQKLIGKDSPTDNFPLKLSTGKDQHQSFKSRKPVDEVEDNPISSLLFKEVLIEAHREAKRLENSHKKTAHILFGLLKKKESFAWKILNEAGVADKLEAYVGALMGYGEKHLKDEPIYSAGTERIINNAYQEAKNLNREVAGTECLLLAVIREGESEAARMLDKMGITIDSVLELIEKHSGKYDESADLDLPKKEESAVKINVKKEEEISPKIKESKPVKEHKEPPGRKTFLDYLEKPDPITEKAFKNLGITSKKLRNEIIKLIKEDMEQL